MPTATLLQRDLPNMRGDARLYRLDPPLGEHEFVIVSAVNNWVGGMVHIHETYIFPADSEGHVTDWCELEGSFQGGTDHARALTGAGYDTIKEA